MYFLFINSVVMIGFNREQKILNMLSNSKLFQIEKQIPLVSPCGLTRANPLIYLAFRKIKGLKSSPKWRGFRQ